MERQGKHPTKIVVAVARELVGYLWAALTPGALATKAWVVERRMWVARRMQG
jgi:hypothetical protein